MKLLLIMLFILPMYSWARPIEVNVRDYGWITSFPVIRDTLDFYLQGIENDLNDDQPVLDPKRINYGTANSTVLASKGLGTDYANDPQRYIISVGVGAAWDEERNVALKDEVSGVGAASSVSVGVRMDHLVKTNIFGLDPKRIMGFVNLGAIKHSETLPGRDIDIAGDISAQNLGIHFRYDLIDKRGSDFFGWGGVKLHVGYELNRNEVDLATTLDEPISLDTGGQGVLGGRLTGTPTFEVETLTHSFPLEASTSLLFLNIFTLYGGLGADVNFGESEGKGNTKGNFNTIACTSGACVGETVLPQLEVQANFDAYAEVRNITFRAFSGLQLDLPFGLHAYGQAEQMLGTKVLGLSTGLKYTY